MSQRELSIPVFLLNALALSVIMTWLYRRTQGDLLLMLLIHVAANYCGWIGVPSDPEDGSLRQTKRSEVWRREWESWRAISRNPMKSTVSRPSLATAAI